MPDIENYDVLVIGSGEAGKYLAWTMAGEGHRTAVVERKLDRVREQGRRRQGSREGVVSAANPAVRLIRPSLLWLARPKRSLAGWL
jgi:2-polyprenyl-6-methoxyphenol hydroxylase-like FAD-dependent oxidoreductase